MHKIDPLAGQVGKSGKVLGILSRLAANNPAHPARIMTQALGVVHVLISSKAAKYRLAQQTV